MDIGLAHGLHRRLRGQLTEERVLAELEALCEQCRGDLRIADFRARVGLRHRQAFRHLVMLAALATGGGPAAGQSDYAQTGISLHNQYRAEHGSPAMTSPQNVKHPR